MSNKKYPSVFSTVWQDAWTALSKPRQYIVWALQPFWRSVKYIMILQAVVAIVGTVYFSIALRPQLQEVQVEVLQGFPLVIYENGEVTIEDDQTFTFTDSDRFYVKVDPTQSLAEEPVIDGFYEFGFLLTKDGVIVGGQGDYQTLRYDQLRSKGFVLTADIISNWISTFLNWSLLFIPILLFLYFLISGLLFSLFFSVLYYIFSGFRLNLVHLWSMALYALTPVIVADYLVFIFGFPAMLSTIVFVIYFLVAAGAYQRSKIIIS